MPKEELEKLDADTCDQLDQVKKGKARKYVLLCKGATVISLIVYKKGSVEKFKKKAKEAGTGQLFYGTVTGKGMDINFQLARSEGFDKEPIRANVMRTFLEEKADFKCKPLFEIVEAAGPVLDDDDPLVQQFMKLQEKALEACDAHPDQAGAINKLCLKIGGHFDQDQPDDAKSAIAELQTLLKTLGAGGGGGEDLAAAFTTRLKGLKPQLDGALANPNASPDIKLKVSEAGMFARKQDFVQAGKLLDDVEALLKSVPPVAPPPPPTPNKPTGDAAGFTQRLKTLKPRIDEALAQPGANVDIKLKTSEAAVFARKMDFAQADKLLDEVEALLKAAKPQAPPQGKLSLVKLGKARIEWNSLRSEAVSELERLKDIMNDEYSGDPDEQQALAEAFKKIDGLISSLDEELGDLLDDVLSADAADREKLIMKAKSTLDRFTKFVEKDDLMQSIDENEYAEDMHIVAPMGAKLQEIAAALGY